MKSEIEEIAVKSGISDGVYAVLEKAPENLTIGDAVVVGYRRSDSKDRGPSVKLGGKK